MDAHERGLANPAGMCFPDAATGYEVDSSGVVAKYNGTGVILPLKQLPAKGCAYVY